jgi:DNA-directed RNA polymerase I, II, and III subunit RPABC1
MESSDDIATYYKIRKTVLEMLDDRGFIVSMKDKEENLDSFKENYKGRSESLNLLVQKNDNSKECLYVEFFAEKKLGVNHVTNFAERLHEQNIKNGILIHKESITPLAKMV